jgi:hypothetical protein
VDGSEAPPLASRSLKLFSKMLANPNADQFMRTCDAATSAPGLSGEPARGPRCMGCLAGPVRDCFAVHDAYEVVQGTSNVRRPD